MSAFYLRIAGIGGQGSVHLAKTLAQAAVACGTTVSMFERPRSAMRLGPITCDLCFNAPAFSPLIVPGEADAVLGMEPLDGVMNAAYYLKEGGMLLLQAQTTPTIDEVVLVMTDPRREEWKQQLAQRGAEILTIHPEGEDMRGRNYYMLGALLRACPQLPVTVDAVEQQLSAQPANLESPSAHRKTLCGGTFRRKEYGKAARGTPVPSADSRHGKNEWLCNIWGRFASAPYALCKRGRNWLPIWGDSCDSHGGGVEYPWRAWCLHG